MRIGIDARLIHETGVGRYIRNLIRELARLPSDNTYIVYVRGDEFRSLELPGSQWEKRLADIPWHSFSEQIEMPKLYARDKLDLLHVPYFNVPVLYRGPYVLTVHDLIVYHVSTGKATKLPYPLYLVKRIGYLISLKVGLSRASHILAVSETTKQEIRDHFHVPADKITVTYEGIDPNLTHMEKTQSLKNVPENYLLYVGNFYPHKNVEMLVHAFDRYCAKTSDTALQLVLVGKEDMFQVQLRKILETLAAKKRCMFYGSATDHELHHLYAGARALVFPSLMEGFGLPALEALAHGTPLLVSDIPVFRELFGDVPRYFDPHDQESLAAAITDLGGQKRESPSLPDIFFKKFDWSRMALQTLRVYDRVVSLSS